LYETEVTPVYILLVDDDAHSRVSVGRFLRQLGHDVVEINNGREALAAYTYTNDPAGRDRSDR
jgi:CheY-like chemotaxis protein